MRVMAVEPGLLGEPIVSIGLLACSLRDMLLVAVMQGTKLKMCANRSNRAWEKSRKNCYNKHLRHMPLCLDVWRHCLTMWHSLHNPQASHRLSSYPQAS